MPAERAQDITLRDALERYIAKKTPDKLQDGTAQIYRNRLNRGIADWLDQPVSAISEDMVVLRHHDLRRYGNATADVTLKILRAICNYVAELDDDYDNPCDVLAGRWALKQPRIKQAGKRLTREEIGMVWLALQGLVPTTRDYLMLLLLTGVDTDDAMKLTWDRVNFQNATIVIRGCDRPIALSSIALANLASRRAFAAGSLWVFSTDYDDRRNPICRVGRGLKSIRDNTGIVVCKEDLSITNRALTREYTLRKPKSTTHEIAQEVSDYILSTFNDVARTAHL